MISYELGALIAIFSFIYTCILTEPNMLLNGLYKRLYYFFKSEERENNGKPYHWLFKILIHCEKCNAGQIAFWLYLATEIHEYTINPVSTFILHLFFITYTILITLVLKTIYTKTNGS